MGQGTASVALRSDGQALANLLLNSLALYMPSDQLEFIMRLQVKLGVYQEV